MNFKKLPKEKKSQLILVTIGTLVIMAALGFGLISYQYEDIRGIEQKKKSEEGKYQRMQSAIKRADQIEAELATLNRALSDEEAGMASGDLYSWIISTVRQFKFSHRVDIPQFNPITVGDVDLLPKFPYKQALMNVNGTAFYHDFGKFLADFENEFPHIRIVNLSLEPAPGTGPGELEKLMFKMDIVALVKPDHS